MSNYDSLLTVEDNITWNKLKEFINTLSNEQRNRKVLVYTNEGEREFSIIELYADGSDLWIDC